MFRPRHPNKHIEQAVKYAESLGWRVEISGGYLPVEKVLRTFFLG